MVRASKSTEKSTTTPVVSAPVVATATAPAPAPAPAADKPKVKKTKAAAAPEPVNEMKPAPVAEVAPLDAVSAVTVKLTEFNAKLQQMSGLFATVKNDFKTLEKTVSRELKNAQKASSKKKRSNVNRKPSGFVKPVPISNELAEFLDKTIGTEMSRTDVSRELNTYIRAHGLKDKNNGRIIHPDEKLSKLLNISKEVELGYFNMQRYMKHLFLKPAPTTA
jgi:chromatin remodeling complex protein RSC6